MKLEELYIGAVVTVNSRQLQITEFGDNYTKTRLEGQREEFVSIHSTAYLCRTLALVKADGFNHLGRIVDAIYREGFRVFKMKMFKLSRRDLEDLAAISKKSTE